MRSHTLSRAHACSTAWTHLRTLTSAHATHSNTEPLMDGSSDESSSAYYYHDITVLFQSVTELAFGLEARNHSATFPKITVV